MAPAPAEAAAPGGATKGGDGDDDGMTKLAMYYAGVAAIIAGILLSWEDETGDEVTSWLYAFHENIVMREAEWNWMGYSHLEAVEFFIACIEFRRGYHSSTSPLFSFTYIFIREGIKDIFLFAFLGQRMDYFGDVPMALAVWSAVNLDPNDTLYKFCENGIVWQCLEFIGACAESIEWIMLFDEVNERNEGDIYATLAMIILSNSAEEIMDAIDCKLATGKAADTAFHNMTWEFRYANFAILAYFFAVVHPETSPLIMGLHPVLNKDTALCIIAWVQIWNELVEHVVGDEVDPSPMIEKPLDMVFGGFRQPVAAAGGHAKTA